MAPALVQAWELYHKTNKPSKDLNSVTACSLYACTVQSELGLLNRPQPGKPAQRSKPAKVESRTGPLAGYIGWNRVQPMPYVAWQDDPTLFD